MILSEWQRNFTSFLSIVMDNNEYNTKENKNRTKDKNEPQHLFQ